MEEGGIPREQLLCLAAELQGKLPEGQGKERKNEPYPVLSLSLVGTSPAEVQNSA